MQSQPSVDPVSVLLVIFTAILGPQFAPAATAYSIIVMGSFVGLMIGVRLRPPTSRFSTLSYSIITMITSLFMTVSVAQFLGPRLNSAQSDWLYFPVAMMTTAFGELWMEKLQTLTGMFLGLFSKGQK